MNLKANINGVEYDIVQGNTFSEEYNETLDSGTLIIDQVTSKIQIKPYDDVYIYSGKYKGHTYKGVITYTLPIYDKTPQSNNSLLAFKSQIFTKYDVLDSSIIIRFYDEYSDFNREYKIDQELSTNAKITLKSTNFSIDEDILEFELNNDEYSCQLYMKANTIKSDIKLQPKTQEVKPSVYYHLLVDQYSCEIINLKDGIYKYKIQLFSETKKLETIQLPNISVTQPLNIHKKKSVWTYLNEFVETYTPYFKMSIDGETWNYQPKYTLDPSLESVFSDTYAPDFSLNNPNLKDVLHNLMLTKDMIPYVKDDEIKALDITARVGTFSTEGVNYVNTSMSSDNYCDNLRRQYQDGLTQENSCRFIEYMGLRNKDNALMTLDNMRVETRFPIYKINKFYLCYYKKGKVTAPQYVDKVYDKVVYVRDNDTLSFNIEVKGTPTSVTATCDNAYIRVTNYIAGTTIVIRYTTTEVDTQTGTITVEFTFTPSSYGQDIEKIFLCKQDITKLVKLDSERNLLISTWDDFEHDAPSNIDELSQYKLCTLGYNIGSNQITGFGVKYQYVPNGTWWDIAKTYIENILTNVDNYTPFGIYEYGYVANTLGGLEDYERFTTQGEEIYGKIVNPFSNKSLLYKALFFEIDYDAFYSGAVVHSKDDADDDITINDNSSSSLTLLEKDGLFQKEKANRFGNEAVVINARYTSLSQLQPLGSVFGDDIIIYHREYNIYNNVINATYYGTKDYVLKNYFTSVYAKHRPYNLMSYGESVRRSENRKALLLLSKDQCYYERENKKLVFDEFDNYIQVLLSFFNPTEAPKTIDFFQDSNKINYSIIQDKYLSDTNVFVSGTSICFNMRAFDNVSGGVYLDPDKLEPFNNKNVNKEIYDSNTQSFKQISILWDTFISNFYNEEVKDDYTGSVQEWYMSVDDEETGFNDEMYFEVSHFDKKGYFLDDQIIDDEQDVLDMYPDLFKLPKIPTTPANKSNIIKSYGVIHKDNKEIVDMTFQIEPIEYGNDIAFSSWMMKLCDLNGAYLKFTKEVEVEDKYGEFTTQNSITSTLKIVDQAYNTITYLPYIALMFDKLEFENDITEKFNNTGKISLQIEYSYGTPLSLWDTGIYAEGIKTYRFLTEAITYLTDDEIRVKGTEYIGIGGCFSSKIKRNVIQEKTYILKSVANIGSNYNVPEGKKLFVNTRPIAPATAETYGNFTFDNKLQVENKTLKFFSSNSKMFQYNNYSTSNIETTNFNVGLEGGESKTYAQNLFIVEDTNEMTKEIVYNEYYTLTTSNKQVDEVFSYEVDDQERPYLKVDLTGVANTTKSIQVWYRDGITYDKHETDVGEEYPVVSWTTNNSKASYKFVFGVNLTQDDFTQGYVKVYISVLTLRNKTIYDSNLNIVGENLNYADSNKNYGEQQLIKAKEQQ